MEAVELRYVTDIREWWPVIKPGIERVLKRQEYDAFPEDVYLALRNGTAQLFVALVFNRYDGFVICRREDRVDGSYLFLWMAYTPTSGVADIVFPKLREIAKSGGMKKIQFATSRKGWERLGADFGFKRAMTIYEAEV
ncbi:MAG TPA: hypothetical protein VFU31_24580 [Candidatus Binatia bacterium]|nr:hypothetical protein [Candidatus Binatia bacterium]